MGYPPIVVMLQNQIWFDCVRIATKFMVNFPPLPILAYVYVIKKLAANIFESDDSNVVVS